MRDRADCFFRESAEKAAQERFRLSRGRHRHLFVLACDGVGTERRAAERGENGNPRRFHGSGSGRGDFSG